MMSISRARTFRSFAVDSASSSVGSASTPTPFTRRARVSMSIGSMARTRLTVLRLSTHPRNSETAGLSAGTRSSRSSSKPGLPVLHHAIDRAPRAGLHHAELEAGHDDALRLRAIDQHRLEVGGTARERLQHLVVAGRAVGQLGRGSSG